MIRTRFIGKNLYHLSTQSEDVRKAAKRSRFEGIRQFPGLVGFALDKGRPFQKQTRIGQPDGFRLGKMVRENGESSREYPKSPSPYLFSQVPGGLPQDFFQDRHAVLEGGFLHPFPEYGKTSRPGAAHLPRPGYSRLPGMEIFLWPKILTVPEGRFRPGSRGGEIQGLEGDQAQAETGSRFSVKRLQRKGMREQPTLPAEPPYFFPDQSVKMIPIKPSGKRIYFLFGKQEGFFQEQLEDLGQEREIRRQGLPGRDSFQDQLQPKVVPFPDGYPNRGQEGFEFRGPAPETGDGFAL